ncbi:hypothetical protein CRDco_1095 [Candidatus Carsonella ruddii (Diaphorina cf. continua)]|uniref:Uncharacterized protein n=1 Tax=Candidatus Carsonella ruddii (Diaphorina cf. continua) TaxID=2661587 RepID=A0A7R6W047_CARRU|nr:hypothetical protein CRDco_1095 [Candidatus Carsonella ruddii (Diaphorina cf. continua)]
MAVPKNKKSKKKSRMKKFFEKKYVFSINNLFNINIKHLCLE